MMARKEDGPMKRIACAFFALAIWGCSSRPTTEPNVERQALSLQHATQAADTTKLLTGSWSGTLGVPQTVKAPALSGGYYYLDVAFSPTRLRLTFNRAPSWENFDHERPAYYLEAEWMYLPKPTLPGQFLAVFPLGRGYVLRMTGWPSGGSPLYVQGAAAFYDPAGKPLYYLPSHYYLFRPTNEPAPQSADAVKGLSGEWSSTYCTIPVGPHTTQETTLEADFSTNHVTGVLGGVAFSSPVKYDEDRLRYYGAAVCYFQVERDEGPLLFSGTYLDIPGAPHIEGYVEAPGKPSYGQGTWLASKTVK